MKIRLYVRNFNTIIVEITSLDVTSRNDEPYLKYGYYSDYEDILELSINWNNRFTYQETCKDLVPLIESELPKDVLQPIIDKSKWKKIKPKIVNTIEKVLTDLNLKELFTLSQLYEDDFIQDYLDL